MDSVDWPKEPTHGHFVKLFLNVVKHSLESDDIHARVLKNVNDTDVVATQRFALGRDDSTYLNAGVALLAVDASADKTPLSSAAAYSAETLKSTKDAVLQLANARRQQDRDKAHLTLQSAASAFSQVPDNFLKALGDEDLYTLKNIETLTSTPDAAQRNLKRIKKLFKKIRCLVTPSDTINMLADAIPSNDSESTAFAGVPSSSSLEACARRVKRAAATVRARGALGASSARKRGREDVRGDDDYVCPFVLEESLDAIRSVGPGRRPREAIAASGVSTDAKNLLIRAFAARTLRDCMATSVIGDNGNEDAFETFINLAFQAIEALEMGDDLSNTLADLLPSGTAVERRSVVWQEMLRDAALAGDRLWTFVRTLSGLIGESADAIFSSMDEAAIKAQNESRSRRDEIAKQVSAFQSKLLGELAGALLKNSSLQFKTSAAEGEQGDALVVVDADVAKKIEELASGTSGAPFFEANVALRHLKDSARGRPQPVEKIVGDIAGLGRALHDRLMEQLIPTLQGGASLSELAHPRNSYCVRLKDDTTAAILEAYDRFSTEFAMRGGGRVSLWELVEGADATLSQRFATFVGHVLVQNRTSTGVNALYTSRTQLAVNSTQAGVSLQRLVNQAFAYRSRVSPPDWSDSREAKDARKEYFESAKKAPTGTWARGAFRAGGPAPPLRSIAWVAGISH